MPFFDPIRIGSSGSVDDYTIDRSLRFNKSDNAKLSRANSSAGDRKKWTFSFWIKYTEVPSTSTSTRIIARTGTGNNRETLHINDGRLTYQLRISGSVKALMKSEGNVMRDQSAWQHIVLVIDTANSTGADRVIFYQNGVRLDQTVTTTMVQNSNTYINSTNTNYIGNDAAGVDSNMYLAECHFLDGYAYDSSYFGETNATTGQWNPKKYTGSYGSQGWYLKFDDNSDVTATTLGKDSSGNGNNWTPANLSVSAGDGNDSVTDTPTLNKATLNGLTGFTNNATLKNGNLEMTGSGGFKEISTIAVAGTSKLYYEVVNTSAGGWQLVGVFVGRSDNPSNALTNTAVWGFANTQATYFGGSYTSTSDVPSWTNNDVVGIKYENGSLKLYKNGTLATATTTSVPTSDIVFAYIGNDNTSATAFVRFNSDSWTQSSAAGVDATWELSTANLPEPTILLPNQHFNTLLYTGNDSSDRDITGVGFQPDWLWIKNRSQTDFHMIMDSVRGANKNLYSNDTDNEQTDNANGHVNSFLTDGFNVDAGGSGLVNENSEDYVAWNWNAGDTDGKTYTVTVVDDSGNKFRFDGYGTSAVTLDLAEGGTYVFNYPSGHPFRFSTTSDGTHGGGSEYTTGVTHNSSTQVTIVVAASAPTLYYYCSSHSGMGGQVNTNSTLGSSNFDGAIQSVVKTNTTAGFSITTYTGTGSSTTVGHGLGVKPDWIIIKCRSNGDNWMVYHKGVNSGVDPEDYYLELNATTSQVNSTIMLNDTAPTSSVVTIGSDNSVNGSSRTYVMYAFSEVSSYSKFGSYVGNGSSSDGTYVFFGFRPAWFMAKEVSSTSRWSIYDNKRDTQNPNEKYLRAQANNAETTSVNNDVDFLSNGVKMRGTGEPNASGINYIYLAFAEAPFKNARAR